MKKILLLLGDYVEDYEAIVPFHALQMVGHEVHAICPVKAAGEKVRTAVHDVGGDQTFTEKPGHNFVLNATFDDVRANDYDGLVVPGGRSPEYIRLFDEVLELVREMDALGKPIAAICHGPQVPLTAGVVAGKKCTGHPAIAPDLRLAGAEYVQVPADEAVVDGNLVTSPAWPGLAAFLREFLRLLGTEIHP